MNWTPAELESLTPGMYDELLAWVVEQLPKRDEV
jgi:hypothetical protein